MTRYPLQEQGLAVIIGTPLLAACVVALRVYARISAGIRLAWNDYLIIFASVLSIVIIYPSVRYLKMWHYGIHIWQLDQYTLDPDFDELFQINLALAILNTPILPLVKASIILLLLKAAWVIKPLRRALYAILAFIIIASFSATVALIFRCPQRTGQSTLPTLNGLSCLNPAQSGIVMLSIMCFNMFTDVLIFPIPILLMRGLRNATWKDRVAVILSFTLVLGASAIGASRLYLTFRVMLWPRLGDGIDWTYTIAYCLTHAENNVAIILACAPPIRTLLMDWAGRRNRDEERALPGQSTVLRQRVIGESLLRTFGVQDTEISEAESEETQSAESTGSGDTLGESDISVEKGENVTVSVTTSGASRG